MPPCVEGGIGVDDVCVVVVDVELELCEVLESVLVVELEEPLSALAELSPGPPEEPTWRDTAPLSAEPGPVMVAPLPEDWLSTRVGDGKVLPP